MKFDIVNKVLSIIRGLITILILSSASDQPKTGWEKDGLKGKVKVVNLYSVKQQGRRLVKDKLKSSYSYDINGNKIEQKTYTEEGKLCSRNIYKYDDNGNMTEECDYDSTANLEYKETLTYDSKGNLIETCIYGCKIYDCIVSGVYDVFRKTIRKYRDDGKLVEELVFYDSRADSALLDILGESIATDLKPLAYIDHEYDKEYQESYDILSSIETYKYDEKGNLIEDSEYWRDSSLHYKRVYKYDENNNKIKVFKSIGEDSLRLVMSYKYNENNEVIEEYNYFDDGRITYEVLKYNKNGKIEEQDLYEDGELYRRFVNKFDTKGKRIEECVYGNNDTLIVKSAYEYNKFEKITAEYEGRERLTKKADWKYDKKGNLVRFREYEESGSKSKTKNYEYDECGNEIRCIKTKMGRGIVEGTITEYEYY